MAKQAKPIEENEYGIICLPCSPAPFKRRVPIGYLFTGKIVGAGESLDIELPTEDVLYGIKPWVGTSGYSIGDTVCLIAFDDYYEFRQKIFNEILIEFDEFAERFLAGK